MAQLLDHHHVVADCGLERLVSGQEIEPVPTVVEHPLPFHPRGYRLVEVTTGAEDAIPAAMSARA
nr:hypothetical protein [Nocardia amikacinitolerans]